MAKKKETENTINSIQKAKIDVRDKVGKIFHDAKQSHRQYSYTSHTAVTAAVVPAMHEAGMTYKFTCNDLLMDNGFAIMKMCVEFHWGGTDFDANHGTHYETVTLYCGDKLRDGTSMGAITSYGLKTALLKYFGLESGEKDLEAIQADQESVNAALLKQKAAKVVNLTPPTMPEMNVGTPVQPETMQDFIMLCKDLSLSSEQIDARLAKDGYENMDQVPQEVMEEWNRKMDARLAFQHDKEVLEKVTNAKN
tara:strand:+ start:7125 stop:7877 length:753 start_codon:yes stop_codon:yes gene_type:complete